MTNNTSDRYNESEIIRRHDDYLIDHTEIEGKTLTKIQGYGVVEKGLYQKLVVMKHIDKEFIQNDREKFDDIIRDMKKLRHLNVIQFLGICNGDYHIFFSNVK